MWIRHLSLFAASLTAVMPAYSQETIKVPYGPPHEEQLYNHHLFVEPNSPHAVQLSFSTANTPDTVEGSQSYKLWYRVSKDAGATLGELRQIILRGDEFDAFRPIRGIDVRKAGCMTSHAPPVRGSNGEIMVPIELWRMDSQGEVYNPARRFGNTYCDSAVLIGKWMEGRADVEWSMGDRVQLRLEDSTAGAYEPALAELDQPGHFVIVVRASNDGQFSIPSYKWKSISRDYCRTWSTPTPLTYTTGEKFFSPSSCSEFVRHSNGRLYWLGNIIPNNAEGNYPRFPLIVAEFDEREQGLKKETVQVVFTRDPEKDSPKGAVLEFQGPRRCGRKTSRST